MGVVAPETEVISLCLFAVRVWAEPLVLTLSQLPRASKSQDCDREAVPVSPSLAAFSVPRANEVSRSSESSMSSSLQARRQNYTASV